MCLNLIGCRHGRWLFSSAQAALLMQVMDKLKELEARPMGSLSDVVVIGGGYAGVELSAVVAEKLGDKGRVKVLLSRSSILWS